MIEKTSNYKVCNIRYSANIPFSVAFIAQFLDKQMNCGSNLPNALKSS